MILRHLTKLELSLLSGSLAIATVGLIFYILFITQYAPKIWRQGLFICMALLFAAFALIFTPFWSRYAAVTGMTGVFLMMVAVAIVRRAESRQHGLKPTEGRRAMLLAGGLVLVICLISVPFFSVINNQEVIKDTTKGTFGFLYRLEQKLEQVIFLLERDHDERIAQSVKDSLIRAKIFNSLEGVKGKVDKTLKNDSEVKAALKRSARNGTPVNGSVDIRQPVQLLLPRTNSALIPTDRVQPVRTDARPVTPPSKKSKIKPSGKQALAEPGMDWDRDLANEHMQDEELEQQP